MFKTIPAKLRVDVMRIDSTGTLTPVAAASNEQNINPYASREMEANAIFDLLQGSHREYFRADRAGNGSYVDCVHVSVLTIKDAEEICRHLQDLFRSHSVQGRVIFAHADCVEEYQQYLKGGTDIRICVCTSFASSGITAEYTSLVVSLNERSIDGIIQVMNRAGRVHHARVCYVYIDSIAGYARGGMGKTGEASMQRVQDKSIQFFGASPESVKTRASTFFGPFSVLRFLQARCCHKQYLNSAVESLDFPNMQQGTTCGDQCSFCDFWECPNNTPEPAASVTPDALVERKPAEAVYYSEDFYDLQDAAMEAEHSVDTSVVQWLKLMAQSECYFCGKSPCDGNGVACGRGRETTRSCSLCDLPIEMHTPRSQFNNYRSCCQANNHTCGTCFLEPKFAFTAFGMKHESHLQECRELLGSSKLAPSVIPPHQRLGGFQHLYRTDRARGFYLWLIRLVNMTTKTQTIFEVLAKGVMAKHLIHASRLVWNTTPVVDSIQDNVYLADTVFNLMEVFAKFGIQH